MLCGALVLLPVPLGHSSTLPKPPTPAEAAHCPGSSWVWEGACAPGSPLICTALGLAGTVHFAPSTAQMRVAPARSSWGQHPPKHRHITTSWHKTFMLQKTTFWRCGGSGRFLHGAGTPGWAPTASPCCRMLKAGGGCWSVRCCGRDALQ